MAKTPKTTLPKGNFTIDLTEGKEAATMKAAEATTGKVYSVPLGKIKIIPGFNPRVPSADYTAHRDSLIASIKANGFMPTKPLAGYVAEEDGKNVIYVTDGHTRLDAVGEFNSDIDTKEEITHLPIIVQPKGTSLRDLTVQLHTANSGRPLTPFELGVIVQRLLNEEGATKAGIAADLAVTPRYIDDVLLLADADSKVKRAIATGEVSSTLAIQLIRKDSESAGEKIEAAIEKAKAKGGTGKVTKKALGEKMQTVKATISVSENADMKDIVKAAAAIIRETIPNGPAEGDEDLLLALINGTIELTIKIPAVEKKAKPAKAPKKKAKPAKPAKAPKAEKAPEIEDEPVKKGKNRPKKGPKATPTADIGIEGAVPVEESDDEVAILPPKVESDLNVPEEDDVDI